MKKIGYILFLLTIIGFSGKAQRYAVIDTKYILGQMPEYKIAQQKLDETAALWQKEVDGLQAELDKMYRDYDAEQYLLSKQLQKKREDEIFNKEKQVRDLQKKRFGYEGDLFKERQKLVKPVQDKVYTAVQRLATEKLLDFILDKSEGITIIFADPKLDKSEEVLRMLGIVKP